jgi:thioredoxin 1
MKNVIIGTKDNLKELISNKKTTIVDFKSTWCGPCKVLDPILNNIAEENPDIQVIKIDVDENEELCTEYDIRSIPAVFIYKNEVQDSKFIGMKSKEEILKLI